MSKLRQQLDRAKADYQSARFPGDLGLLVDQQPSLAHQPGAKGTPPLRTRGGMSPWMQIGTAFAVAACLLVGVALLWSLVNDRGGTGTDSNVAVVPKATSNAPEKMNVAAVESTDEDASESFSIVPPAEMVSFAVLPEDMTASSIPTMPSFDEFVSEQAESTMQNN